MRLTLERLVELQADAMADDIPIDYERMSLWTEGEVTAYFESGGQEEPAEVVQIMAPSDLPGGTSEQEEQPDSVQTLLGWSTSHEGLEMVAPAEDDDENDGLQPRLPASGSLLGSMMFKLCFVLMILCPLAVLLVAARALLVGVTEEDHGTPRWSPPSSPMVPILASLVAVPVLGILIGIFHFARRRCAHLDAADFWTGQRRSA